MVVALEHDPAPAGLAMGAIAGSVLALLLGDTEGGQEKEVLRIQQDAALLAEEARLCSEWMGDVEAHVARFDPEHLVRGHALFVRCGAIAGDQHAHLVRAQGQRVGSEMGPELEAQYTAAMARAIDASAELAAIYPRVVNAIEFELDSRRAEALAAAPFNGVSADEAHKVLGV